MSNSITFREYPSITLELLLNRIKLLLWIGHSWRSQWSRGLTRGSAAARLLRSWIRIPPGAWMFVCCECCVLSGRGLCDGLIARPEESYGMWCVVVCDLRTSRMRRPWPALGRSAKERKKIRHSQCLAEMRSTCDSTHHTWPPYLYLFIFYS